MKARRQYRAFARRATNAHRQAWDERASTVIRALTSASCDAGNPVDQLADVVDPSDPSQIWLTFSVLSGQLPPIRTIKQLERAARHDGAYAVIRQAFRETDPETVSSPVRVATNEVVVDLGHTITARFVTGIQRVALEMTRRWYLAHRITPAAWTVGGAAMCELSASQTRRLSEDDTAPMRPSTPTIVVPWRGHYIVPELIADEPRASLVCALASYSHAHTGLMGYDCIPLVAPEVAAPGMADAFTRFLFAAAQFDRLATDSKAAADEFRGWKAMLSAVGLSGPQIEPIPLPESMPSFTPSDLTAAKQRFIVDDLPMVLCVGSHEPRKNHLAVLHAAERLWRAGARFSLSFIGGNSWEAEEFNAQIHELQQANRPVDTARAISDGILGAAYTLARFTMFPSFDEGFGLPVAESLSAGTPVITSRHGSMAEIAEAGGALLVDPHDDDDIMQSMDRLLRDDDLLRRLQDAAARRPSRTWDDFARETWRFFIAASE